MNPGGPFLQFGYTDTEAHYHCMTCGHDFYGPRTGSPICPKCAGIAGIPARIWARFTRLMHRINELEGIYDLSR